MLTGSKKNSPKTKSKTDILAFLRSVKVELALVKWPDRQETLRLTFVVIITTLLVGAYIGGLDLLFTNILTTIISNK